MKRIRAISFAFAALAGVIAGLPATIHADDTEIYVGNRAFSAAVRPNVLLVLDTSGSMSSTDGEALDRLDRVKVALDAILDDVNDMNIGLARFHTPGGPILFPVSYVDEDAQNIELGLVPEINQRLVGSENDAEQLGAGSVTVIDSPQLELTRTESFGNEMSTVLSVESSSDDARERPNGTVDTTSRVMNCCATTNGLRFQNVPIARRAPILNARIQFVSGAPRDVATSMTFYGHDVADSPTFTATSNDITGRARTSASVAWTNVPEWDQAGDRYQSPNLKSIIQEIVDAPAWAAGNALSILFDGLGDRRARTYDFNGNPSSSAQLFVEYGDPATKTGKQLIGLRFNDVRVPQKQGIKSAVLELVPVEDGSGPVRLEFHGEAADDSAPFTAAVNDISARPPTLNKVQWDVPAVDWQEGVAQTSPDLTAIVQEIVNRPGWCGGNAMTFGIDDLGPGGPRIAASFDGNPGAAPLLRIDFDTTSPPGPGEGCTIQEVTVRPSIVPDDANQNLSDDAMGSADPIVQMDASKANGLRFQDVTVPPGVTITDARLVFTAADPGAQTVNAPGDPVTISFTAHAIDTAGPFAAGSGTDVVSRPKVAASVSWSPPVWITGDAQTSPDLSPVIDAVVNGVPGWVSGNDLAILMSTSGAGSRNATSYDVSPADAPQLRITMRARIGDQPAIPVTTVRQRLKQIINELDHEGTTPIVDNLYEAAAYFRGEAVKWGLNRGTGGNAVRRSTRVSHPASYTGGSVVRAAGCTDLNLDSNACVNERITGSPTYISPIETECQANFIVLLTDGLANRNSSRSLIRTTTGDGSCSSTLPLGSGGSVSSDEECGLELTSFLNDPANDQNRSVPGPNNVTTYTIGLEISNDWLKQLAAVGGGKFYEAGSTQELRKTFNDITANILQRTASFATPSLSVNTFNRLLHLDEVYFSLFEPVHQVAWPGNVKKYKICADTNLCSLGQILDANGSPAIGTDGRILPTAKSFWVDPADPSGNDGAEILEGGAGNTAISNTVPPARHLSRRVLTFTDLSGALPAALDAEHEVKDDDGDGILDGLVTGTDDERLQDTKDLLGWPGDPVAALTAAQRADLVIALHDHIQWIRGQDVDDENGDGDTSGDRYSFNDPLHSSAVAFTLAGTNTAPVVKVVVGTNDGGVRFINGSNGLEEFIFYPQSMLRRLASLRENPTGPHRYGMDGTATIWLNDVGKDGTIKASDGDFAHVIIGQRRGGNEIISLDVTPRAGLGDTELAEAGAINHIDPVYNWRIRGGGTQYPRLGQTWSRAKLATVLLADPVTQTVGPTTALLFAGGYDDVQDSGFGAGGLGNAIYMANPLTGERWLSISQQDPGSGSGDRVVVTNDPLKTVQDEPKMVYPIPSDLALLDSNGDGNTDRIYVADTGGQVWRVDLAPADPVANTHARVIATIGRLATVSSDQTLADQRKFFEPPDVVQVRGGAGFSSVANYDLVTIVSGNRANPLNTTVEDRFYAFRDTAIGPMNDGGIAFGSPGHGNAAGFTTLRGALDSPFTTGDLFDVTNIIDPQGTDLANLQNANGYYVDLTDSGEKGLSSPIVLEGIVFFTTYLPEQVVNVASCSLAEGAGLLYGINVLNGTAVFNWDQSPATDPLSIADRRMALGSGIPSAATPIFQPDGISLLIGGSSGATVVDPGLALPRARTFWFEEAGR